MVEVEVAASASDICDTTPSCHITSVSSNEPANGLGDGGTAPDWKITGDLTVDLRAERSGKGEGRIYTIAVTCTDTFGNSSVGNTTVTVAHDRRPNGSAVGNRPRVDNRLIMIEEESE